MGFKTIDLDSPDGYKKYKRMKETNSVKAAFEEEEQEVKKNDNEKIQNVPEKEPEVKEEPAKVEVNIPKEVSVQGVVTGVNQLRVRTRPEGDIMYLISEKSVVTVLEEEEGWYKVETAPGRTGWVMKQFIQRYSEGG